MKLSILFHLLKADFLERVRSYRFFVVQMLAVYLGYAAATDKVNLFLDSYRGVYNSAWVGLLMTMSATLFFSWFGFFVIRGSVQRDYETGVGQIIATTPLNRGLYAVGKTLSNFAILCTMTLVLAGAGVLMVWFVGEGPVEIWPLVSPFLFIALPPLAITAAVAVLFEMVSWLRGGFGNVVYFLGFGMMMPWFGEAMMGLSLVVQEVGKILLPIDPTYQGGIRLGAMADAGEVITTFVWPGFHWTWAIIGPRLAYVGVAVGMALVGAVVFDRFDPAKGRGKKETGIRKQESGMRKKGIGNGDRAEVGEEMGGRGVPARLSGLAMGAREVSGFNIFIQQLVAELKVLLKGQAWWWYAGAVGLLIAQVTSPLETVRQVVLPIAWIWPVLIWSGMGNRERQKNTAQLVFSAPHPLRQLGPVWTAGVLVAVLTGAGAGVRLLGSAAFVGWFVGALFIPSLALALGVLSGGSRLFEVVYLLFWYIGPMNKVPALDYLGAVEVSLSRAGVYLLAAGVLGLLAVWGRGRELQH